MVLGHAFFPGRGKGGDTHFDEDEKWADVKGGDKGKIQHNVFSVMKLAMEHRLRIILWILLDKQV